MKTQAQPLIINQQNIRKQGALEAINNKHTFEQCYMIVSPYVYYSS